MENILTMSPTNIAPHSELSETTAPNPTDLSSLIEQAKDLPPPPNTMAVPHMEFDDEMFEGERYAHDFTMVTQPPPGGFPEPLWDPFFLKQGIAILYGPPDSGKSQWLRHFSLSVALGRLSHLNFPLNAEHNRVIYVVTEDDTITHGQRMLQMARSMKADPTNIGDRLETIEALVLPKTALCKILDHKLDRRPADVVIIDVFSDVFTGSDMNSNTEVRDALAVYAKLANKHKCLVILNHHPNKSGEKSAPDKTSLQGAGALYAKSRALFEIRGDDDGVTKYFTAVKGNNLKAEHKTLSFVMNYSEETGLFEITGERIGKQLINQPSTEIDWAAIFEHEGEMRSGDIVRKLMDRYSMKERAANNKLRQLPKVEGKRGHYRNPSMGYLKAA